ncbi:MAG: peptide deformylase [Nitrospiraceae bacterium]|nr:peptide deformylase [Nitrospiraceae bacterium]
MAIRDIVLYPDAPLKQKAESYDVFDGEVAALAADMFETMAEFDGCGLAGPQVGVAKRIVVLRDPAEGKEMCLINPEILEGDGEEVGEEGCLSLPAVFAEVPRKTRIRLRALDEHGEPLEFEATGMLARIIQHETDHLDGKMFIDRLDVLTHEAKMQEWLEVRRQLRPNEGVA